MRKILVPFIFIIVAFIFISATVKVMPVGDSLTAMNTPGYRGYLFQMLKDSGFVVDFVGGHQSMPTDPLNTDADNSGFGGYVIGPDSSALDPNYGGKGHASITYELENHEKIMSKGADVIILMIGVNDFWNNKNTAYSPSRDGAIRLDSLVEKIYRLSPNVKLILSNLTPTKSDLSGSVYANFNADVPLIVEKQKMKGKSCYFVDNNKGDFVTGDYLDGVHFVASGFQKLAKNFYNGLVSVLREMAPVASVHDVESAKVVLFPNPVTNEFTLKNVSGSIEIVNVLGQIVTSRNNYQGEMINVNEYTKGTYIIRTSNETILFMKQ